MFSYNYASVLIDKEWVDFGHFFKFKYDKWKNTHIYTYTLIFSP